MLAEQTKMMCSLWMSGFCGGVISCCFLALFCSLWSAAGRSVRRADRARRRRAAAPNEEGV